MKKKYDDLFVALSAQICVLQMQTGERAKTTQTKIKTLIIKGNEMPKSGNISFLAYVLQKILSDESIKPTVLYVLIENGLELDAPLFFMGKQVSILPFICQFKRLDIIIHLKEKLKLKITPSDPFHPIGIASIQQHVELREYLVRNINDYCHYSPITMAVRFGYKKLCEEFIQTRPEEINQSDQAGLTPLLYAAQTNRLSYYEILRQSGADISMTDLQGRNLAFYAASAGNLTLLQKLVEAYPPFLDSEDSLQDSLLVFSIKSNQADIVHWLDTQTEITLCNNEKVILSAFQSGQMLEWCLNHRSMDANIKLHIRQEPCNILMSLCYLNQHEAIIRLDLFRKYPHLVFEKNHDGNTLLDEFISEIDLSDFSFDIHFSFMDYILKYSQQKYIDEKPADSLLLTLRSFPILVNFCLKNNLIKVNDQLDGRPILHLLETFFYNQSMKMAKAYKIRIESNSTNEKDFALKCNQYYQKCTQYYQSNLQEFSEKYRSSLNLNIKDQQELHLLAKLVHSGVNSIKRIKWLLTLIQGIKLVNLDRQNSSLLHLACEAQNFDLIRWCVEKKNLSIIKVRADGLNALDLSLKTENQGVCLYLLEKLSPNQREAYLKINSLNPMLVDYVAETKSAVKIKVQENECDRGGNIHQAIQDHENSSSEIDSLEKDPGKARAFVCNQDRLMDAIHSKQITYLRQLKSCSSDYEPLLTELASALLKTAIEGMNPRVIYQLLRIPTIKMMAHLEDNAALDLACRLENKHAIYCLLKLDSVRFALSKEYLSPLLDHYLDEYPDHCVSQSIAYARRLQGEQSSLPTLNPHAETWTFQPRCSLNPSLQELLDLISHYLMDYPGEAYLYGSALYKTEPHDFDILLTHVRLTHYGEPLSAEEHQVFSLIERLGGEVLAKDRYTGRYGYRKRIPNLHVIPIKWQDFQIDLVLSEHGYKDHAKILDFTIGAMYYSLKTKALHQGLDNDSIIDILKRRIETINDPYDCFQADLNRLFRAIRLMVSDDFVLSEDAEMAIKELFFQTNPFIAMGKDKLINQLNLTFKSLPNPAKTMAILEHLGVLPRLMDYLASVDEAWMNDLKQIKVSGLNHDVEGITQFGLFHPKNSSKEVLPNMRKGSLSHDLELNF